MWFDADDTEANNDSDGFAGLIDDARMLAIRVCAYTAIGLLLLVAIGLRLPWIGL